MPDQQQHPGPVALVGSGEFLPVMAEVDRALLDGRPQRVAIIPTSAGLEGDASITRWIELGEQHYDSMGVETVAVRAIDPESANSQQIASLTEGCGLAYFSGGDPTHAIASLRHSATWYAVQQAWLAGSALAGCSAGAMMMGSVSASPRHGNVVEALGFFKDLCVMPHFDRISSARSEMIDSLAKQLDDGTRLVGIDENTALVIDQGQAIVHGVGNVYVIGQGDRDGFGAGDVVDIDLVPGAAS